jgi:hypothetical protein
MVSPLPLKDRKSCKKSKISLHNYYYIAREVESVRHGVRYHNIRKPCHDIGLEYNQVKYSLSCSRDCATVKGDFWMDEMNTFCDYSCGIHAKCKWA